MISFMVLNLVLAIGLWGFKDGRSATCGSGGYRRSGCGWGENEAEAYEFEMWYHINLASTLIFFRI